MKGPLVKIELIWDGTIISAHLHLALELLNPPFTKQSQAPS